jgi:hypothetical protein
VVAGARASKETAARVVRAATAITASADPLEPGTEPGAVVGPEIPVGPEDPVLLLLLTSEIT